MARQYFAAILIGFASLPAVAQAQSASSAFPPPQGHSSGQQVLLYASTAGEGWLRGEADWMRGFGESARSQAEADYIVQLADAKYLENRQQLLAARDARRAAQAEAREAESARRRRETMGRQYETYVNAQTLMPEIEAADGQLAWPVALQEPEFETDLETISACLSRWAQQRHTLSRTDRNELRRSLEPLQTQLRRQRLLGGASPELAEARDLLQKIETLVLSTHPVIDKLAAGRGNGR
jgi:hypothetical protein